MTSPNVEALSFSTFIAQHEGGELNHDLSKNLQDLIAELNNQVQEFGGVPSGSITLKITAKHQNGVIVVSAKDNLSMPDRPRVAAVYYSTADNKLCKRDPRQVEMPFRDVKNPVEQRDIA